MKKIGLCCLALIQFTLAAPAFATNAKPSSTTLAFIESQQAEIDRGLEQLQLLELKLKEASANMKTGRITYNIGAGSIFAAGIWSFFGQAIYKKITSAPIGAASFLVIGGSFLGLGFLAVTSGNKTFVMSYNQYLNTTKQIEILKASLEQKQADLKLLSENLK